MKILQIRGLTLLLLLVSLPFCSIAQIDSIYHKLSFTADFRFRIEPDWNSRKSDGSFRDNRTRVRYRARFGANYKHNDWASLGFRIRTGNPIKQQDPQLTLGADAGEFNILPIGFEKIFFKAEKKGFELWLGKNTFPFRKLNELFWSDNVYPQGAFLGKKFDFQAGFIESLKLGVGHFLAIASNGPLTEDNYFQGFQIHTQHFNNRLELFPSFYYFQDMPNVPDGAETYTINYGIFHLGTRLTLVKKPQIDIEADYYYNIEDLQVNDSIPENLNEQKTGLVVAAGIGNLKEKGNWQLKFTYTYLERYSAVDIFAQNDWARWDYSNFDSPDGRLTNYQGLEIMFGYAFDKKLVFKTRYFIVEQLIPYGEFRETGSRIRFDLDIGF